MHVDAERLVALFLELVKIDAVSRAERPVNDYIIGLLNSWGLSFIEDDAGAKIDGNAGNLIVRVPGAAPARFFLCSHTDTVRPTRDLKPIIDDGVIRSGGDTILGGDNRAGLAIILYLLESVMTRDLPHEGFEVYFTISEEIGLLGATHLDPNQIKVPQGYVFDSSRPPGDYIAETPTAWELEVDVFGAPAHAGVAPETGINALTKAAEMLVRFPVGRVDSETVANFGVVNGGDGTNVVPAHIHLEGEIRSFSGKGQQMIEDLASHLAELDSRIGGTHKLHHAEHFKGFQIAPDAEVLTHLESRMHSVGLVPAPQKYSGGSDANVFNAKGVPTINLGIGAKDPHANTEHIAIADLVKMAELAQALVAPDAA